MRYTRKAPEGALDGPYVDALVDSPLMLRQNTRAMRAHVPRGRDLVGDEVRASQRDGYFEGSPYFRPP